MRGISQGTQYERAIGRHVYPFLLEVFRQVFLFLHHTVVATVLYSWSAFASIVKGTKDKSHPATRERVRRFNYRKLSELTAQIHKIGVLYNQAVRAINSYHSVKTAQILLETLEQLSAQILALQEQVVSLTIDYRK